MSVPFIAFYPGDYQRKTQHLTTLQHGALFLLLQHCWTHGAIPLEPAQRAAIARLGEREWQKVAPAIDPFFDASGRNKRAAEEHAKAEIIRTKRALAGRIGGLQSGRSKAVATGKQMLQQTLSKHRAAVEQPLSICVATQISNIKTTTSRVEREPPGKPPHEVTRAELDDLAARRRAAAHLRGEPCA